jgi:hypothetical protein
MDPDPYSDPDADPYSAIFVSDLQDVNKKFSLLLFAGTFTSFFKDKKSKTVGINVFLIFLLHDRRI